MPLKYIIDTVAEKLGYDVDTQRALLLRIINRAAKEVYESADLPDSLFEVTVTVLAGEIVALPYYVGELRAMRNHYCYDKIPLREMMPKYSYQPWLEREQNWRLLSKSPIQTSIEDASAPIEISIADAEAEDIVITVTGSTAASNKTSDEVTLAAGALTTQLNKLFLTITSITKESVCEQNITFTGLDADGADLVLAVLPNDRLESLYQLVDVSALPNGGQNNTVNRYVDVLFKSPLSQLSEDGDSFQCSGFDDAIVAKVLEHEFSVRPGSEGLAMAWLSKCDMIIKKRMESVTVSQEKVLTFMPNPILGLHPTRKPTIIY